MVLSEVILLWEAPESSLVVTCVWVVIVTRVLLEVYRVEYRISSVGVWVEGGGVLREV